MYYLVTNDLIIAPLHQYIKQFPIVSQLTNMFIPPPPSILAPSTAHLRRCCYVTILNNVEEDIGNMGKNVRCPTCGTNSHSQKMSENVGEVGECKIKTTTNSSPPLDRLHQCCINTIYENAFKNKQNKIHNPYEDVDCHYQPCKMVEDSGV